MTDTPLRGKFNEQKVFVSQMRELDQKRLQTLQNERQKEEKRILERQEKTRDDHIKLREEQLTKKAKLDMNMPRPPWAPKPTMPTRDQIRETALQMVRDGDKKELARHNKGYDLAEKKLIEKSLQREAIYKNERDRGP